jgi:peptidoglycan/LPS O-acetylase OafA/YrhL
LRIVPLAYFASFVVTVFVYPDLLKSGTLPDLWRPLLFLYYAFRTPGPISALWALSVEVQYYIIAPFIFILLSPLLTSKARAYVFMVIVFLSGLGLRYYLFTIGSDWVTHRYMPLYANLDFFLVGFGINRLIEQDKQRIRESSHYKVNASVAVMLCFLMFIIASGGEYSLYVKHLASGLGSMQSFYTELVPPISLILTFSAIYNVELYKIKRRYAAATPGPWYSFSNKVSRTIQVLGLLTYGLYVWHEPVLTAYSTIISKDYSLSHYFLICSRGLLLVAIMCFITYFTIERPFENYRR